MRDFIASYCHKNDDKINSDLFNRTFDRPLVDFAIATCKNLEVLPAIKLVSWEYITDQTKIHTEIDKDLTKDPNIKKNKALERLASTGESFYDLLILHFRVRAKDQEAYVTRKLRIPKLIKGRWYIRGGKKVLPLIQVVDNSTFVKGNILNFKTTLYPIKLYTTKAKLTFIDGEILAVPKFHIDLFKKVTNPFLYYLAQYGIEAFLEMFCVDGIISVVDDILDEDHYMYLKINNGLYLEVHEKGFYAHEFIGKFVGTLYDALMINKNKITLENVYDQDYWLETLSEVFSKKKSVNKGERTLISFRKITDAYTKSRLLLRKFHKKNTATIIRWMMVNYEALLKKDSHDLKNKRMRINEVQAYFFDSYITRNVYSLLNTDNPPFEKYIRLLNAINENTLIRSSHGGGKSSPTSMFRYERYNDFDAIELSRYTLKGPTGINGGKKKTSLKYRDIYPSHLGRYDINICSSSDQGLTGYLCSNLQFNENGYFSDDNSEPDEYDRVIDNLLEKCAEDHYREKRDDYIQLQLSRDSDGFITLQRKLKPTELNELIQKYPWEYGVYYMGDGYHLLPKMDNLDQNGFIQLSKVVPGKQKKEKMKRDSEGFIILEPVVTKMKIQEEKAKRKKK